MTAENHVYFPLTGTESHGFVCVRLFSEAGSMRAEASIAGPMTADADNESMPFSGEPHQVLRQVRELAGLRGLDVRVKLDGVDWDPELGSLVS